MLLTTPAFHAVKTALPTASLTLLASPAGAQVGTLDPDIERVLLYEAPWVDPWQELPHDSAREQQLIARIKEERFDGAIIFTSFRQSSLPAAYLCYLADIPLRVAASVDGSGSLLTTRHKHPKRLMHEVERGLDLVGALGMRTEEKELVLRVPPEARQEAEASLTEHGASTHHPLVVVHPGCSMPARTYLWEQYAELINLLIEQIGACVIISGAKSERALVEQVRARVRAEYRARALGMAGELAFPAFCALIERADLVITNNTGPMHIAAAVKTPVVALFALTNPPEQWGPWRVPHRLLYHDMPCRICYSRVCPYGHECLRLVTPEHVASAAAELLAKVGYASQRGDTGASREEEERNAQNRRFSRALSG